MNADEESNLVGELITGMDLLRSNCSNKGLRIVNNEVRRKVEAQLAKITPANQNGERSAPSAGTERATLEDVSVVQRLVNRLNPNRAGQQNAGELRMQIAEHLDRFA